MSPIYKDNKNNTWYFKVCIKGRQFLRRGFDTKKEAKKAEATFLLENEKRPKEAKKELTYCELLQEYKKFAKNEFKITYYLRLAKEIDNYYSKLFKDIKISKLTYTDVTKARTIINNANVAVDTKNNRRNFLIRFFKWVRIYHDYDFYLIERMQRFKDYKIKRMKYKNDMVQYQEFIQIYTSCDSSFYRLAFLTFYLFGLRVSELLGLRPLTFDFENKRFEIFETICHRTGLGHYIIVKPKSNDSQRFYFMPDSYIALLKNHIQENKLKSNDFIFFSRESKRDPIPLQTFRDNANKYCEIINPGFHFHRLRKSTVTHLHDKNVSLEDIKDFVGHSDSKITEEYYLKESNEKRDVILKIMEETISDLR